MFESDVSTNSDTSSAIKDKEQDNDLLVSHQSPSEQKLLTSSLSSGSKEPTKPLSKNKQRKQRIYEKALLYRPLKRQRERERKKEKGIQRSLGKEKKLALSEKLLSAFNTAPKVVVDCQFDERMSNKQRSRLAQQLRRTYSSNRAADSPLHLIFTSLTESSDFFKLCCKQNDGFSSYVLDRKEQNVRELFPNEQIVYLSPDSSNVLSEFNTSKIYVIGGIVDESKEKNISLSFSNSNDITTARLPIDEHFVAENKSGNKVLCVNQVFDIILEWYKTKDWVKSIAAGLPERTGFIPRKLQALRQ